MGLLSLLALALLWAAVQAAGHHGCCTTFSNVHAVRSMVKRGGAVQCRWQGITEGCNINAVVVKWRRRLVCVDSTPRKMQNLIAIFCSNRNSNRRQRKKTRSSAQ